MSKSHPPKKPVSPPPGVPSFKSPSLELPSEWDTNDEPVATGVTLPSSVELAETHQELAKTKGELDVAKAQIAALQREKISLAEAFDNVHNEVIALRAQLASAKADFVASDTAEVATLRSKVEELTRQLRRHHGFKS